MFLTSVVQYNGPVVQKVISAEIAEYFKWILLTITFKTAPFNFKATYILLDVLVCDTFVRMLIDDS